MRCMRCEYHKKGFKLDEIFGDARLSGSRQRKIKLQMDVSKNSNSLRIFALYRTQYQIIYYSLDHIFDQ